MNKIVNKIVTGYTCSDSQIEIYDNDNIIFYLYENPKNKTVHFNLPCGVYFTDNEIHKRETPVKYICPPIPKPFKNVIPKEMNFFTVDNPSKASIDISTGDVFVDFSIEEKEKPFKAFVFLHELGHNYYYGGIHERYCDLFAAKTMLEKLGFNRSQVYLAHEFCLSDRSVNRKDYLYNYLKQVKQIV